MFPHRADGTGDFASRSNSGGINRLVEAYEGPYPEG